MFSGAVTSGVGESIRGGDRGDEDLKLPSSEHDEAASEQGRFASVDSFCVSTPESPSTFFLLHLDWPQARNPFANGLLSIFNFVIRSFCKDDRDTFNSMLHYF